MRRQGPWRQAVLILGAAALIGCGGQAAARLPITPVPLTQQLLFVLLAGAVLGSRPGALAALLYLMGAAALDRGWPPGTGAGPLTGPLAGYLWGLPLAAYAAGYPVERLGAETWPAFAVGVCAGIGIYDALGVVRLTVLPDYGAAEAALHGAAILVGQQVAQGGLATLVASSASTLARTHGR